MSKGAAITLASGATVSIQETSEGVNLNIGTRGEQVQVRANASNDFDFVLVPRQVGRNVPERHTRYQVPEGGS